MTVHEMIDVVGRITYKPNVSMYIVAPHSHCNKSGIVNGYDWPLFGLIRMEEDINRPGIRAPIVKLTSLPYADNLDRREFVMFMRSEIAASEMHEMDEFLKLDGACVIEPHPELNLKVA